MRLARADHLRPGYLRRYLRAPGNPGQVRLDWLAILVGRDHAAIERAPALLACYPSGDAGMRNVAVAVLRQMGSGGQAVAVMGLSENYVATLHNRALREGLPGLVRDSGRPRKLAEHRGRGRGGGGPRGPATPRSPGGWAWTAPRWPGGWPGPACRSGCPATRPRRSRSRRPPGPARPARGRRGTPARGSPLR